MDRIGISLAMPSSNVNDVLTIVLLVLLSIFAVIFYFNNPLFGKMLSNISVGEQRQSIFESTEKDRFFFNAFMIFQALFLSALLIYLNLREYKYLITDDIKSVFIVLALISGLLFAFYLFKLAIYAFFGSVFITSSAKKVLFTNYQSLFCTFGVVLYLPVLWILLVGQYFFVANIMLIISYIIFRAVLFLRFFYVFFNKNTGLFFFSLYLCAQEIVPLVFFYEGLIYMYNFIEESNICQ